MKHRTDAAEVLVGLWGAALPGAYVDMGWTEDDSTGSDIELFLVDIEDDDVTQPNAKGPTSLQMQDDYTLMWRLVDKRPHEHPRTAWKAGGELVTTVVDVVLRSDRLDESVYGLWRAYPSGVDGPKLVTVPEGIGTYTDLSVSCRHRFQGGQRG